MKPWSSVNKLPGVSQLDPEATHRLGIFRPGSQRPVRTSDHRTEESALTAQADFEYMISLEEIAL